MRVAKVLSLIDAHSHHSTLRERIAEHLFVGKALQRLWQRGIYDVEVSRSEFDAGGFDIVMTWGNIVRHIQFKAMINGGHRRQVGINLKLASKPSGCVIWMIVDEHLDIVSYLWLGGLPGDRLNEISAYPEGRATRANAKGEKASRPGERRVPRSRFTPLTDLDAVLVQLFGALVPNRFGAQLETGASPLESIPSN